jgi:asparagine synthase (glutamine-hydrolysing)
MCDLIRYRGPDEEGIWVYDNVGLGMRRLSIIDLAGGSQPIFNEDRTVATVFNGEIYNFIQLRERLQRSGHTFRTNSDTEVIVHLYEEMGASFVKELRGMFAIALYDVRKKKLLLARDRLGKKPLYYAESADAFYFGSEIKSLLAVSPASAELDESQLPSYFFYGYIPGPGTIFKNVYSVLPGHLLEYSNGKVRMEQYWEFPRFATFRGNDHEALEQLESILAESVRLRLISDVPVGALLSGGVDSSTIVAMMAKVSNAPIKTFTIGFKDADFNEAQYAREVAKTFGTDHYELVVEADLWQTFQDLTSIMDEPFSDSSLVPTYLVSKIARKHVTVALSGDGGDELFAGYGHYPVHLARRHLDLIPGSLVRFYKNFLLPVLPSSIRDRKLARNIDMSSRDRFIDGLSLFGIDADTCGLFSPEFASLCADSLPARVAQGYFDGAPADDFLSKMQFTDIKTYLADDILKKVDRASMAASLETRAPLLDQVFVEFAASLSPSAKLRGSWRKVILCKLAERLGVPRKVLYRKKQGFALPLLHWMRKEMSKQLRDILLDRRTLQRGYFTESGVTQLLREHESRKRDHSAVIWSLVTLELWHRNFLEARVSA